MKVFVDRDIRRLFIAVGLLLLMLIIAGQVMVDLIVNDYKNALIAHDAGLAGALVEQGADPITVVAVFTTPKPEATQTIGYEVLQRAGVTNDLNYRFVPEAKAFLDRYSVIVLVVSLFFSTMLFIGLSFFFVYRDRQIDHTRQVIERFMRAESRGETDQAIFDLTGDSLKEGSLAQLFSTTNSMAATLTAHLEKEQQNREFLKETISDISHQLKTPLAALQMYIDIIRDENRSNPVIADFTSKSERELNRMEYLIQNLLKLARLDANAISLEKHPFVLSAFGKDIQEMFAVRAEVESKQIKVHCPDELMLEGDKHWLTEAVSNLVKNAFDHTTAGGLIQIVCEETPLMVTIAVLDNGSGIHPGDLPHIFKRFYRSRFSQDRQGVGIGLTLVRSIIEKHGGSIMVESEPGQGAIFRMIFPKLTDL